MDSKPDGQVRLSLMSGEEVNLDPPAHFDELVLDLRQRLNDLFGVTVAIFHEEVELEDHDLLRFLLPEEGAVELSLSVMKLPCKIRPNEYDDYIDRDVVGFIPVSSITVRPSRAYVDHRLKGYLLEFPEPRDININMMPFKLNELSSIPEDYQQYWPIIEICKSFMTILEHSKVCYLTIHESTVAAGSSQRRAGLHIESPGFQTLTGRYDSGKRFGWGGGRFDADYSNVRGGIFTASNVPNSCKVWNVVIDDAEKITGSLGSLEHLRDALGEGSILEANKLYWLTDVTPHESLPLEEGSYRQFFRLVVGPITAWYADHSTSNPLVEIPDKTQIIYGNKFADMEHVKGAN